MVIKYKAGSPNYTAPFNLLEIQPDPSVQRLNRQPVLSVLVPMPWGLNILVGTVRGSLKTSRSIRLCVQLDCTAELGVLVCQIEIAVP